MYMYLYVLHSSLIFIWFTCSIPVAKFYPFKPNGLLHPYQLAESVPMNSRVAEWFDLTLYVPVNDFSLML